MTVAPFSIDKTLNDVEFTTEGMDLPSKRKEEK